MKVDILSFQFFILKKVRHEELIIWRIDFCSGLFMKSCKQEAKERREDVHPELIATNKKYQIQILFSENFKPRNFSGKSKNEHVFWCS